MFNSKNFKYEYVDFPIYSPVAYELAKWMVTENNRIKASKLFKMVCKYENLHNKRYENLTYEDFGRKAYFCPLNTIKK